MLLPQELEERIAAITNLPTLPQVASRLMRVINNPATSAADVARIISLDPSLSAKTLRLANSAFYGMPRSITSIGNAVVILGLRVINTLVLSLTVFDMFPQDQERTLFDRRKFWRHSLGCAEIAKLLAQRCANRIQIDPEEAFCAGLLHDIGKVVMEQYLHDEFRKAMGIALMKEIPLYEAEKLAIGVAHTDIAAWLTREWDLPQVLQLPMQFHHHPLLAPAENEAVNLIHLADSLCYELELSIDSAMLPPERSLKVAESFGLTLQDSEVIALTLPAELEKMELFFEMASVSGTD